MASAPSDLDREPLVRPREVQEPIEARRSYLVLTNGSRDASSPQTLHETNLEDRLRGARFGVTLLKQPSRVALPGCPRPPTCSSLHRSRGSDVIPRCNAHSRASSTSSRSQTAPRSSRVRLGSVHGIGPLAVTSQAGNPVVRWMPTPVTGRDDLESRWTGVGEQPSSPRRAPAVEWEATADGAPLKQCASTCCRHDGGYPGSRNTPRWI